MRLLDVCFSNQQVKFASQQNCKNKSRIPETIEATAPPKGVLFVALRTGLTNLWPSKRSRLPYVDTENSHPPPVDEPCSETVVDKLTNLIVR